MKNKGFIITLIVVALVTLGISMGVSYIITSERQTPSGSAVALHQVAQQISASGSIHSQQEVTLHFQTGGKVIYLPFKQGDSVYIGQTIAQLDTYALQKQLQIQANADEVAQNNNAQVQENDQAGIVEGQQRSSLDLSNHNSYTNTTEAQVITDTVQRLVSNSLLTQNTAQLQTDLANYSLQLASLTAPFSGIITAEDITTPNVNITPTTGFSLADPTEKVFRANVDASDIDFVSVGTLASVQLDGSQKAYKGTVITVYPQKQILPSGEQVYQVDIQAEGLNATAFGQNGSVIITSNNQTQALLIPTWAIVGHTAVWVWRDTKSILQTVTLGKTHGAYIEVTSGLSTNDKVIIQPETIAKEKYSIL